MNIEIRYYTKSGHTQKLAKAIAEELNITAKTIDKPLENDVDILFLGSSIYGNSIDPAITKFFNNINVNIGLIVNFSTAGSIESTYEQVKELAQLYNIPISSKEFHCPGEFVGMNTGRPNNNDIENMKKFTHNFI